MRAIIFKIISFLAIFVFAQSAVLPWIISNNTMPLWVDIALLTLIIMMWLAIIDRLTFHMIKILRRKDELTD